MRIESTDERERLYEQLAAATGQRAKSKAIDDAARYYLRMRGGETGYGVGAIVTLLQAAEDRGGLTAPEIAEILDTRELPVSYETEVDVGPE